MGGAIEVWEGEGAIESCRLKPMKPNPPTQNVMRASSRAYRWQESGCWFISTPP
jgi:hypothetical protein